MALTVGLAAREAGAAVQERAAAPGVVVDRVAVEHDLIGLRGIPVLSARLAEEGEEDAGPAVVGDRVAADRDLRDGIEREVGLEVDSGPGTSRATDTRGARASRSGDRVRVDRDADSAGDRHAVPEGVGDRVIRDLHLRRAGARAPVRATR